MFSKEIYAQENNTRLEDYNSIQLITANTRIIDKKMVLNEYQTMPDKTVLSEVHYQNDPSDKWIYFLQEILNPDEAITEFFIDIRNDPFITTIDMDNNGVCSSAGHFSINSNGVVKIAEKDYERENYHINAIPTNKLDSAREFTKKYFKGNFDDYLMYYRGLHST